MSTPRPLGPVRLRFCDVLRSQRLRAGLSRRQLAVMAGLEHSTVVRYELDQRWPSRTTVLRLANALRLDGPARDQLLTTAGYAAVSPLESALADEPELLELAQLLRDQEVPLQLRIAVRNLLALTCQQARQVLALGSTSAGDEPVALAREAGS